MTEVTSKEPFVPCIELSLIAQIEAHGLSSEEAQEEASRIMERMSANQYWKGQPCRR